MKSFFLATTFAAVSIFQLLMPVASLADSPGANNRANIADVQVGNLFETARHQPVTAPLETNDTDSAEVDGDFEFESEKPAQYEKEYSPELATVSLVINEQSGSSLMSALRALEKINKTQFARVGEVIVVTKDNPLSYLEKLANSHTVVVVGELSKGNTSFALRPVLRVPEEYPVTTSPSWIVDFRGKRHIFEGNYLLPSMFDARGKFLAETWE